MKVVASPRAVELVQERGGSLYVWRTSPGRCCSGTTFLRTSDKPPRGIEFTRTAFEPFELHLAPGVRPDTLELEARRKRVEAYWNGCAWVV